MLCFSVLTLEWIGFVDIAVGLDDIPGSARHDTRSATKSSRAPRPAERTRSGDLCWPYIQVNAMKKKNYFKLGPCLIFVGP